ncbi:hypothetical protein FBEOM_1758 [Fusarium beomiforme]|uniref:Uncharacterized protein n=1 Tax=Fusarium beomiforme TaxID=44412 RepID=A0A9P5ATA0_9HYPO|nr:hypothetical protein FBEOM_1758 [Fusarium beomiforme]
MRRYTTAFSGHLRNTRLTIESQRRWISYDKSELSKQALLNQIESELNRMANGKRARIHPESKTVDTDAGKLPISPVMDYKFMQSRRRTRKALPGAISGQFRKKLSNNPYAEALMWPIRWCKNTNVALPRYFLQDFELVDHPDPNEKSVWWAPGPYSFLRVKPTKEEKVLDVETTIKQGSNLIRLLEGKIESVRRQIALVQNEITKIATKEATTAEGDSTRNGILAEAETEAMATGKASEVERKYTKADVEAEANAEAAAEDTETNQERPQERRARVASYALSRKSVIDMIGSRKNYQARLGAHGGMSSLESRITKVFRPDMGDVILEMLRREAADTLITRSCREGLWAPFKFIKPISGWEEARMINHASAILYIPKEPMGDMNSYATLDIPGAVYGGKMAVHDLRYLLGEEELERLRKKSQVFRENDLLVLKSFRSGSMRALNLLLWRLQGYLASPQVEPIEGRQY